MLLVESEERRKSDLKNLEKKLQKQKLEWQNKVRELNRKEFACIAGPNREAQRLLKKSKYHKLAEIEVKNIEEKDSSVYYKVSGKVVIDEEKIEPKCLSLLEFFPSASLNQEIWGTE